MDPSDQTMSFVGRMKMYINKTTNVWMRPFAAAAHLFVRSWIARPQMCCVQEVILTEWVLHLG